VPRGADGRTDHLAAEVTDNPVSPADLTATISHLLGTDPHAVLRDGRGRLYPLSQGRPITALLPG
jgi:hypothetical protein